MITQKKVLVVEDDAWLGDHHVRMLESAGYKAWTVPHALAAIDDIDTYRPDILVLDMLLVGSTAFALLHEVRSHVDIGNTPVILCTNAAGELAGEDMTAYGIKAVLDKTTMQPIDLIHAVDKVLL
ncbi:MAG: response regulator [Candidatus Saccharimonadales bacterium]